MKLNTIFALLLFLLANNALADQTFNAKLTKEGSSEVITNFDCTDKIIVAIDLQGVKPGIHKIRLDWVNPRGKKQESVDLAVGVNKLGRGSVSGWIQLHKGKWANLFAFMEPSLTLEEYIGEWDYRVWFKDRLVFERDFYISC